MKTNCASRRGARSYAAAAFTLLSLLLWQAAEARAQWTTSGNTTSTTNNVGVGTATPAQMFHVHSPGTWAGTRVTTAATGSTVNDGVHFGYDDGYGAYLWNREATPVIFATNNTERARFSAGGNFGIGTASPSAKLHIISADDTVAPALSVRQDTNPLFGFDITLDTNVNGNLSFNRVNNGVSAGMLTLDRASGNVGIGTATPALPLDLRSAASRVARFTGAGANHSGIQIDAAAGWNSNLVFMNGGQEKWYLGNRAGSEHFSIIESTGLNEILTVTQNGRVGVGTTAPTTALHVVGDITATGNIAAKYQDLAEWVPSTQELAPGTVVILDADKTNHVMASTTAYDTSVAGVISAQPGITLGERGEGNVLVATTGRVRVRVDATRAPVKVGDLLVTGDAPGVAMKSEPIVLGGRKMHSPGTIIGKALEPLKGGVGEILVLLSLQ